MAKNSDIPKGNTTTGAKNNKIPKKQLLLL